MHRREIWIVVLLAATLGAAATGAHASSAAPTRATTGTSTTDATYSCRVSSQRLVDLGASVTLPPSKGRSQPGVLVVTTGTKTSTHSGVTTTVAQVGIRAVKNGVKVDTSSCSRVKRRIPLKPKGLPGPPTTVTPTLFGHDSEYCGAAARVLVRLRLTTTNRVPSHALLAIRNDNKSRRPIAFYNWSPSKITLYTGKSCTATG
jgi:hypothetical protein